MAGWYCADCGGRIVLGPTGELGLKLACLECDVELVVNGNDLPEVDWAYHWDWEDDGASSQAAFCRDGQVDRIEGMRGRLGQQSLSGSMPWE
jgi:hypothetical protein